MLGRAEVLHLVADPDRAAPDYVRPQPPAIDQAAQNAGPGQLLEVAAGLAQLDPDALDLADAEAAPDQVVQGDSAGHHVAADLVRRQLDARVREQPLERLRLEQRQVAAGLVDLRPGPLAAVIAVAADPAAGHDVDRLLAVKRSLVLGADEDPLDAPGRQITPSSRAPSTVSASVSRVSWCCSTIVSTSVSASAPATMHGRKT